MGIARSADVDGSLDDVAPRVEGVGSWYARMLTRRSAPALKVRVMFAMEPGVLTLDRMGKRKVDVNVMLDPVTL